MAGQVGALRVTVGADISGLQTGMKRAERQVSRSAGIMSRAVGDVKTSLNGLGTVAGVSLGAAGLLGAAGAFIRIADAAKSLRAQLKLATAEYGSFERAQKDVRSIAEATRSDLLATADLYSALQRNSGQLGTTQEQVARATLTVAESFKISGAATSEQSAATRQLIQAFQSGVLRGDEFNSIMENAPRLAKLLADSLGVTTGQLRKMAEAGELTADKLVRAFTDTKFTDALDDQFRQLPVTFDQAMSQLYNSAIIVFSEFDRGGQFSTSLANFVTDGAKGFDDLGESAFKFGQNVGDTFTAIETIRNALGELKTDGIGSFLGLTDATFGWRDALSAVLGSIDAVINGFANIPNLPGNLVRGVLGKPLQLTQWTNLQGNFLKSSNQKRLDQTRQSIMGRSAADMLSEFGMGRKPPPFHAPAKSGGKKGGTKKAPRDRSEDTTYQFERELRQAQMDVLRAQQSMVVTHDERARIALQLLDLEKQDQDAELKNRVRKAEEQFARHEITKGALDEVKAQAGSLQAAYDKKDALERQAVADDLLAQKTEDAVALSDSARSLEIERLQDQSQLAETSAEKREIELRILELLKQQEKAQLEAVIADTKSSELAKAQAQQRLDSLDSIYAGRQAVTMQGTRNPFETWAADAANISDELSQLKVDGIGGLVDTLMAASESWDDMKDVALNAIKQIIAELIRLKLMKFAANLIGAAAGGVGGFSTAGLSFGGAIAGIPGIPGLAGGGGFNVLGKMGVDKNVLAMNGIPIANVSYGERVNVSNDNGRGAGMAPPAFVFNNYARMSSQEARATGAQAAAGWNAEMAKARNKGIA